MTIDWCFATTSFASAQSQVCFMNVMTWSTGSCPGVTVRATWTGTVLSLKGARRSGKKKFRPPSLALSIGDAAPQRSRSLASTSSRLNSGRSS